MLTTRIAHPLGSAMCLLALLLLGISTASAQPRPRGRDITGSVVDVDNNPVANATVAVSGGGPTATTAADGAFKLTGVATTNVALEITADGYTAKQVPLLGATTALQLQVVIVKPAAAAPPAPTTRVLGGLVTDAGHLPIAGATVRVQGTTIQTVTGADGTFQLSGVAIADVTLEVEAQNQSLGTTVVAADKLAVLLTVGTAAPTPVAPTTRTIRGKVLDPSSGEPVAAAEVTVVGTSTVVFTEADGAFVLENLPIAPVKLSVTGPGYETRSIDLAVGQDAPNVQLALSAGEQIVVEGRAPVIVKTNLANGASVVDDKDLNRVSAQTLDTAMTAKISGANLQSNSGAPGGGAQLRLRGISTINGQSSPLYVIDGVIISNVAVASGVNAITAASAGGSTSNQDNPVNRLADLNPNDIETLEVLKGASAAALYGSKASNGVVIITTKRGRNGENHANVTQRIGVAQVSNTLGSRKFANVDQVINTFGADSPYVDIFNAAGGKTYDHESEITRATFLRETIGSASGGTENGNYFGSVLVSDTPGVVKGTFYEKQPRGSRLATSSSTAFTSAARRM